MGSILSWSNFTSRSNIRTEQEFTQMGFFSELKAALLKQRRDNGPIAAPHGKEGRWELIHEVSDEFEDGNLNRSKWDPFNKNWKGRAPGWFCANNVTVDDGCLQLKCRYEDAPDEYPDIYHTFSTAFVRSKAQVKYGYFEVMVNPSKSTTSSAWWFVRNSKETWNEIDVFEVSQAKGHESKFHMNAHVFRQNGKNLAKTLSSPSFVTMPHRTCEKPFVVGLDWTEDYIEWSIEGSVVRRDRNLHWHDPMWVQFDCETMGNWFGLPQKGDGGLPSCFKVFYFRAWRRM